MLRIVPLEWAEFEDVGTCSQSATYMMICGESKEVLREFKWIDADQCCTVKKPDGSICGHFYTEHPSSQGKKKHHLFSFIVLHLVCCLFLSIVIVYYLMLINLGRFLLLFSSAAAAGASAAAPTGGGLGVSTGNIERRVFKFLS